MTIPARTLLFLMILSGLPVLAIAQSSTLTGSSRSMNPAISVNGLIRGQASRDNPTGDLNGFRIDGVELQFLSVVDPFWKANFNIGMHPAHAHEGEEDGHTEGMVVHVEEGYIDGQSLPGGLGLRVGKFALPFGKHAPLHMHQFPFSDAPVVIAAFIGGHIFSDTGAMGTVTVPVPWYSDLRIYGVSGEAMPFDAHNKNLVGGGRLTNLWDMTEDATLELSGSYLHGPEARHPG